MKKNANSTRLRLIKETVRTLSAKELARAAGGIRPRTTVTGSMQSSCCPTINC